MRIRVFVRVCECVLACFSAFVMACVSVRAYPSVCACV